MSKVLFGKEAFKSEGEIIETLRDPKDVRHIQEIPIILISELYDAKNLVRLAKDAGMQNKVGYLADFSLLLLERHAGKLEDYVEARIGQVRESLQYISQELEKDKKEESSCLDEELRFYSENAPERIKYPDRHLVNKDFCRNLEEKWKVIGVFGVEEMYDYMRFIMPETRRTVSQLPIEELVR